MGDFYKLEMGLKMYYWGASPPDPPETMPLKRYLDVLNTHLNNVFIKLFLVGYKNVFSKTFFMILHFLTLSKRFNNVSENVFKTLINVYIVG